MLCPPAGVRPQTEDGRVPNLADPVRLEWRPWLLMTLPGLATGPEISAQVPPENDVISGFQHEFAFPGRGGLFLLDPASTSGCMRIEGLGEDLETGGGRGLGLEFHEHAPSHISSSCVGSVPQAVNGVVGGGPRRKM